ncbi:LysR family transcriptional regulator [Mangrovimicrobium sediminis]|nr:LysR family transcriptional regulator [Haliea sp. SAOS-164]
MNSKLMNAEWSDIRVFLAIVDSGNLVSAAEQLDISQPTAGRRLAALESALGVSLFVRTGRRMVPTDAGTGILESARIMQREMVAIQRLADGQAQGLSGTVTISASEGTGSKWLIPVLGDLRRKYPDITVDLRIESRSVDLVQREADIALRMARPTQLDLICRKLSDIGFGLYASTDHLATFGAVEELGDLNGADWVRGRFLPGERSYLEEFLTGNELDYRITLTTNSPAAQMESVRHGLGFGLISHRWASLYPDVVRVLPDLSVMSMELWLVTHEDLRHSARIKAVADVIAEHAAHSSDSLAWGCGTLA